MLVNNLTASRRRDEDVNKDNNRDNVIQRDRIDKMRNNKHVNRLDLPMQPPNTIKFVRKLS